MEKILLFQILRFGDEFVVVSDLKAPAILLRSLTEYEKC